MFLDVIMSNRIPLTLRLAGLWIIWAAWCQCFGWGLSAIHQLSGWGYLAAAPFLFGAGWWWLKITSATGAPLDFSRLTKLRRRFSRPLPMIFLGVALFSLVGALIYTPWSFDATTYRLPRLLYWWAAQHWYWIGTLDHRLDFNTCGQEWQMLPVILFTRTDRLLFLLNWIPCLFLPGLIFVSFRSLGVSGRSARRWMWLLPAGYCYALQSGGLQNDGFAVGFVMAAIVFAWLAFRSRRLEFLGLAILGMALLTGNKLSNLPLLLPLGALLLPALRRVSWLKWKMPVIIFVAVACSFVPLALLSLKNTGDWTGDPTDQWNIKTHSPLGGIVANTVILANDATQLPVMPGSELVSGLARKLEEHAGTLFAWLKSSHRQFSGVHYGQMVYEGGAGLGFGVGSYLLLLLATCWWIRPQSLPAGDLLPWAWRLAPWLTWIALAVFLAKLGSGHSARIGAPFYPLLLVSLLRLPRIAAIERKKFTAVVAGLAACSVVPIMLLTPARPVIPVEKVLGCLPQKPALETFLTKYRMWAGLRDDLAPMRNALPPDTAKLGYAGAFRDTSYGLWKPFGSRTVVELGLPLGGKSPPPADLKYAVVTGSGLRQRYDMDLKAWCEFAKAKVIFEMQRNISLEGAVANYDSWYLVQFQNK